MSPPSGPGPVSHLRVAVTGPPGCGKSTLCLRVARELGGRGARVGGLATADLREKGERVGFGLCDLTSEKRGVLAHVQQREGPAVGKYRVNLADLDTVGAGAIEGALRNGVDLLVVDEVGPMELHSPRFIAAVEMALASPLPLLVSVHQRANHPLARRLRGEGSATFRPLLPAGAESGSPPSDATSLPIEKTTRAFISKVELVTLTHRNREEAALHLIHRFVQTGVSARWKV